MTTNPTTIISGDADQTTTFKVNAENNNNNNSNNSKIENKNENLNLNSSTIRFIDDEPEPLQLSVKHLKDVYTASKHYLVECRAVFLKIGDIDTLNEKFYAEIFIEAKWVDHNLTLTAIGGKDATPQRYNPEKHFNPHLYVVNNLGELKQQVWYNQYTLKEYEKLEKNEESRGASSSYSNHHHHHAAKKLKFELNETYLSSRRSSNHSHYHQQGEEETAAGVDGCERGGSGGGCVIVERRRVSGQFYQTLDLKNFPADVQELTITLSTPKQEGDVELRHSKTKSSSVNVKCFADSQQWRLYQHIIFNEFKRDSVFSSETFSALDLTLNVARRPTFYYWNAFFLIFLITLSSLSIFSINCDKSQNRIQTTCTLLLTSVTFKWVVTNRSLPFVSYMTSLDKYSIACILFICAQCIWHSIISSIMGLDQKCENDYLKFDHIAFCLFCLFFLVLNGIFLVWLIIVGYEKRRRLNKLEQDYQSSIMGKRTTRLKSMIYGI